MKKVGHFVAFQGGGLAKKSEQKGKYGSVQIFRIQ